jgi:site-specific DNA-methyltransferase (adenine-specific)
MTALGSLAQERWISLGPHSLYHGDCLEMLASLGDDSVDACVTDPPYGLSAPPDIAEVLRHWLADDTYKHSGRGFMGRNWDSFVPGPNVWRELFRVLKPGAHAVVFAGQRTVDLMTIALRIAGFEVRELFGWLQWQGFPKSLDLSKEMDRIHGAEREVTGMLPRNAPGASIGASSYNGGNGRWYGGDGDGVPVRDLPATADAATWNGWGTALKPAIEPAVIVRKPISESSIARNVLRWGTGALNIDACRYAYGDDAWPGPTSEWPHVSTVKPQSCGAVPWPTGAKDAHELGRFPANVFACPKASTSERELGCEGLAQKIARNGMTTHNGTGDFRSVDGAALPKRGNFHPTVKPARLIRWLLRLVTPPGGVVVDPFVGSGTVYVAAGQANEHHGLDCTVIGSELGEEPGYIDISPARFEGWRRHGFPLDPPKGPAEQRTIWDV